MPKTSKAKKKVAKTKTKVVSKPKTKVTSKPKIKEATKIRREHLKKELNDEEGTKRTN